MMTSPMLDALAEFRVAARAYLREPSAGTRYALNMAAEELKLLGLNPEWVTPDGYESPTRIPDLIAKSSIGRGLANIKQNGIDAELDDLDDEMK